MVESRLISLLGNTVKDAERVLEVHENKINQLLQNNAPYVELEVCGELDPADFENFYRLGMFPINIKCVNCVCSDCKSEENKKHLIVAFTNVDEKVRKALANVIIDEIKKRISNG